MTPEEVLLLLEEWAERFLQYNNLVYDAHSGGVADGHESAVESLREEIADIRKQLEEVKS